MGKKIIFFILSFLIIILIIELTSRIFVSLITQKFDIFSYGFNKRVELQIRKLSKFDFEIVNNDIFEKKKKLNFKKEKNFENIWVFGGSTSDVACRSQNDTSWPNELNNENYKITSFAKSGTNTDFALNSLISKIDSGKITENILWANFANETDVIFFGFKKNPQLSSKQDQTYKINKFKYFIKSLNKSLKNYSVSFYILDDFYIRLMYKLNLSNKIYNLNKTLSFDDIKISAQNYYLNTKRAIELADKYNIKFFIVTLFDKSDIIENKTLTNKEKVFFDTILKIIDEHKNVNWINLKRNQKIKTLPDINKVFCDNIHFTKYGNILVSELIKNYLKN